MTATALKASTDATSRAISIDQVFPHAPETIWKALTSGELMARWMMPPTGFEPVKGHCFTFKTRPAGAWDGTIHCQVLDVIPNQRLAYAWKGGDEGNVGYGSPLDTVVTFTLSKVDGGTRLQLIHSGFTMPRNETAYRNMNDGWKTCVGRLDSMFGKAQ
jgi:uncharacterized protein YndB with AHSA1/START domain